ncbi:unnamed protein product [Mycena citricolor]|uniref:F-box domain-containing protein n=1 Tax=Mycena citricolor TaxID=2018698 RepID=A0AAD2HT72_9AGAR|nr:unnamed protein product [Mycena citricolor]
MTGTSLHALPSDVVLQILVYLDVLSLVALSCVDTRLKALSQEHSFWFRPLAEAHRVRPLACPAADDLSLRTAAELRRLALHSLRLERNWSTSFPSVAKPVKTLALTNHDEMMLNIPGTNLIVLEDWEEATLVCMDVETGEQSDAVRIGAIYDMSSPVEDKASCAMSALSVMSGNQLRASSFPCYKPAVAHGSVRRGGSPNGGQITGDTDIQSVFQRNAWFFVLIRAKPAVEIMGSVVFDRTIYLVVLVGTNAFVYACPEKLLAIGSPSADIDYTIRRSHVARVALSFPTDITRVCFPRSVLSSEPRSGRSFISVTDVHARRGATTDRSLEVTFWRRPWSESDDESAQHRLVLPVKTVVVEGKLTEHPASHAEPLIIANSGLTVLLLVEVPEADSPKMLLIRYDPAEKTASTHELRFDASESGLDLKAVRGITLDDHIGVVMAVTEDKRLHVIPYA